MSEHGTQSLSPELESLKSDHPHLDTYLTEVKEEYAEYPLLVEEDNVDEYVSSK